MRNFILMIVLMSITILNATDVSGNQSGLWTLVNSPYNVTADILVPAGQILTIEPGVIVQINGLYQIKTQGYLIAEGNETDSIKFTSTSRWKGFRLEDTANASSFKYCKIEKVQTGINPINSPINVNHCFITDASDHCISIYGINGPAQTNIKNSKIANSVKSGIYITQNSNVLVDSCEVFGNGTGTSYYAGIQLANQSDTGECDPVISNNWIHNNLKQGISAWDVSASSRINPHVHHNLVENNLSGIYFREASGIIEDNIVQNNFIVGNANSGAGIMISKASAHPIVRRNTVTGNYTGFYIGEGAVPNLGSPDGEVQNEGLNIINNNADANGTPHSIVIYSGNGNVLAQNNIWGTTDTELIDISITDQLDNPALGLVTYDPMYSPTNVSGNISYTGNTQFSTLILYFYDYVNGETENFVSILDGVGPYSVNVPVGNYYVQAIGGNMVNDELEPLVFGVYGTILNPIPLHITADQIYTDINIALNEYSENISFKILDTYTYDDKTVYPLAVFSPFGVEGITLLFKENDYIYAFGTMELNQETGEWIPEYYGYNEPVIKNTNFSAGDHWGEDTGAPAINMGQLNINIETPAGTFNPYRISYYDSEMNEFIFNKMYFAENAGLVMIRDFDPETNNLSFEQKLVSYDVSNGGDGLFPLATNNIWVLSNTEELPDYPSYLSIGKDLENANILHWDAPSGSDWTAYHIYQDNSLLETIPITQCSFNLSEDYEEYDWMVKAYNGSTESEASNIISHTGTTGDIISASKLSIKHYPNPISYSAKSIVSFNLNLPENTKVELNVFNIKGQKVATIKNEMMDKGEHKILWDAKSKNKNYLANGVYFYQIKTNKQSVTKKLLIMK